MPCAVFKPCKKEIQAKIALLPEAEREAIWERYSGSMWTFSPTGAPDLGGKRNFHNGT